MKFKVPAFLEGIKSPIEGEVAMRKFAASEMGENAVVVGIDEVGRGPLAGPVVACAAVLKAADVMPALNDSKKLTRPKREAMYQAVQDACECFAVASASVEEIDRMNILEADFLAMRRALQALGMPGIHESEPEIPIFKSPHGFDFANAKSGPVKILIAVDGNLKIHGIPEELQIPVVKGDGRIASISAASILAKVFRDRYMDDLEKKYPGYGFDKHAGYGTKAHLDAIRRQGMTPEHRKSFHPKSLQTELDLG